MSYYIQLKYLFLYLFNLPCLNSSIYENTFLTTVNLVAKSLIVSSLISSRFISHSYFFITYPYYWYNFLEAPKNLYFFCEVFLFISPLFLISLKIFSKHFLYSSKNYPSSTNSDFLQSNTLDIISSSSSVIFLPSFSIR